MSILAARTTSHAPGLRLALARRGALTFGGGETARKTGQKSHERGIGLESAENPAKRDVKRFTFEISDSALDNRPLLLDLFCSEGGAHLGYERAGFRVVGVDIEPMPNYPGEFIQADARDYLAAHGHEYDFIHASPPCQEYSVTRNLHSAKYPELIKPVRALLQKVGKPYAIENVTGAPLINPIVLCGSMFPHLAVYRHRLFECSFPVHQPAHHRHYDNLAENNQISRKGYVMVVGHYSYPEYSKLAMGIYHMSKEGLAEAIPPVYAQYIGAEWLRQNGYRYVYPPMNVPVRMSMFERWESHRPTAGESAEREGTEKAHEDKVRS